MNIPYCNTSVTYVPYNNLPLDAIHLSFIISGLSLNAWIVAKTASFSTQNSNYKTPICYLALVGSFHCFCSLSTLLLTYFPNLGELVRSSSQGCRVTTTIFGASANLLIVSLFVTPLQRFLVIYETRFSQISMRTGPALLFCALLTLITFMFVIQRNFVTSETSTCLLTPYCGYLKLAPMSRFHTLFFAAVYILTLLLVAAVALKLRASVKNYRKHAIGAISNHQNSVYKALQQRIQLAITTTCQALIPLVMTTVFLLFIKSLRNKRG